ncbi:MAG TPA: hypothetical protein VE891_12110 [Allosphingosinicella sp.]|nr:hypothetical protein [Allosphingosinicella sp.]
MKTLTSLMVVGSLAAAPQAAGSPAAGAAAPSIVELRQYKIVAGRRDAFTELFEREFADSTATRRWATG